MSGLTKAASGCVKAGFESAKALADWQRQKRRCIMLENVDGGQEKSSESKKGSVASGSSGGRYMNHPFLGRGRYGLEEVLEYGCTAYQAGDLHFGVRRGERGTNAQVGCADGLVEYVTGQYAA